MLAAMAGIVAWANRHPPSRHARNDAARAAGLVLHPVDDFSLV